MTARLVGIVACVSLTLLPAQARADWFVRPFAGMAVGPRHGFVDLEQTSHDSKPVFGVAGGWQPRAVGVEFEMSMLPGFFDGPNELIVAGYVQTIMGGVVWQLPKPHASSPVRAYIAGGAGIVRVHLQDALDAFSSTASLGAANAGGGVLVRVRPGLDISADVRYFRSQFGDIDRAGFSERHVSFTRVAAGMVFRF